VFTFDFFALYVALLRRGLDLLSARPCSEKNVEALHLGRQTLFFLEKTGDLFSHLRSCVISQFFSKLATFFCSSLSSRSLIISGMKKNLPLLLWGPFLWGPPVRPNMLNMPKSAAACADYSERDIACAPAKQLSSRVVPYELFLTRCRLVRDIGYRVVTSTCVQTRPICSIAD